MVMTAADGVPRTTYMLKSIERGYRGMIAWSERLEGDAALPLRFRSVQAPRYTHGQIDTHTHTYTASHVGSVGSLQSDSRDIFTSLPLSSTSGGVSTKRHRVPVFFFHERVVGGTTEISAKIRPYRRVPPILCLRSSRCDDISVSRN